MGSSSMSKAVVGFVVGVAVALTGAVILMSSDADAGPGSIAPGEIDGTFVPIKPCRLFDLRSSEIGLRTAPLAPGELLIQQVRGEQGNCNLPDDVVGVSMNVTIVEPTAASHLTVYPVRTGGRPLSSNLNWVAGQAPTANKVDVAVSNSDTGGVAGRIGFYNAFGTVYVIADIVGYYTDTTLDAIRSSVEELSRDIPRLTVDQPQSGERYKVTATATIDLDTGGLDAGTCTIMPRVEGTQGYSIERVGGLPVEFSDDGIPSSRMRIPITVIQVFDYTLEPADGDQYNSLWFRLECTPSSGAFDMLGDSVFWEVYSKRTYPSWG